MRRGAPKINPHLIIVKVSLLLCLERSHVKRVALALDVDSRALGQRVSGGEEHEHAAAPLGIMSLAQPAYEAVALVVMHERAREGCEGCERCEGCEGCKSSGV